MENRSKIIFGGEVLMDLTADTITPADLAKGVTAHDKTGDPITGTSTKDMDTSTATATAAELLEGSTAGIHGRMVTGTMPNNGAVAGKIATKAGKYTIPQGYHDGSGTVEIDPVEQAKLMPANIREGVTVLGVEGTMSGSEGIKAQAKTVTPSTQQQVVLPDDGYTHLAQVTVAAIPYSETPNAAGGLTVTIG